MFFILRDCTIQRRNSKVVNSAARNKETIEATMPKLKMRHRCYYDRDGKLDLADNIDARLIHIRALSVAISAVSLNNGSKQTVQTLSDLILLETEDIDELLALMERDQIGKGRGKGKQDD